MDAEYVYSYREAIKGVSVEEYQIYFEQFT